jgi:hypothetical protein
VWDTSSGQSLLTLGGHAGNVWGLGLDARGERLVSGDSTGLLKLWHAPRSAD